MFLALCAAALVPAAVLGETVTSLAPTADGKLLFVVTADGAPKGGSSRVLVWDLSKPELKSVVTGLPVDVRTIQPTADGARFVVVSGDEWRVNAIEVWDVATKKKLRAIDVSEWRAGRATISPDGNWVAHRAPRDKDALRVWNTDTGKRSDAVEKAVGAAAGALAFTADSKRLIALTLDAYTEYDLATGKAAVTWKRAEKNRVLSDTLYGDSVAILPGGKGVVTVAATAKRRQSYVIHLRTEKKDWFLGEVWDYASAPVLSPDGKLLVVTVGSAREQGDTYALKFDAEGAPELTERKEDDKGPFRGRGRDDKQVPAWRAWSVGEATRFGRELPTAMVFSPDGKRLFVAGRLGRINVFDTERQVLKANLFTANAEKDGLPAWHIVTANGECVGSPLEVESLTKSGKVQDAPKVKAALGK